MMRALTWHGTNDVRVDTVSDPEIINPRDAIIKITSTAICGSDLHLYDGVIPGVAPGDVLGHEFMGEVVETGSASDLKKGQRVVVPFTISCGGCFHCKQQQYSACDNSNPAEKQDMSATLYGQPMAALFGYSHLTGGYSGGQAEYARVPFSDVGPIVVPDHLEDDKVLFLSDILPTGWMAAENADIVQTDVLEALTEMTGGIGPDAVIDAVGMESHGFAIDNMFDVVKQKVGIGADRASALKQAILAVRFGGKVSIPGVYGGMTDKWPLGAMMEKGLQVRGGQTHVQKYTKQLLEKIEDGTLDTTFLISHRLPLEQAAEGYKNFKEQQNEWTKVILKPGMEN